MPFSNLIDRHKQLNHGTAEGSQPRNVFGGIGRATHTTHVWVCMFDLFHNKTAPLQFATQLARACLHRGDSARRSQDAPAAAVFYDAALAILETTRGRSAPALVGPLLRLAQTLERLQDDQVSQSLLQRVRKILRSCCAIEDSDKQNTTPRSSPWDVGDRHQPR